MRALPSAPPPNDDPSSIRGNLSLEHKELLAKAWGWKAHPGKAIFGDGAAHSMKVVELDLFMNPMGEGSDAVAPEARCIAEVVVQDGE